MTSRIGCLGPRACAGQYFLRAVPMGLFAQDESELADGADRFSGWAIVALHIGEKIALAIASLFFLSSGRRMD